LIQASERKTRESRTLFLAKSQARDGCIGVLGTLIRFYKERSGGEQARILDALNHYVRRPDGGPIQGLSVELSPAEQELYRRREVDLAVLPDRTKFLEEIQRIMGDIERELFARERNE